MGGKPRTQQEWAPRPSPLAKVHLTRPISQDPTMGLVRDPQFWKRFSLAVHQTEDLEKAAPQKNGSVITEDGDAWLVQQRKKKRKCRILCVFITIFVAIIIAGFAVLGWFFTHWKPLD